MVNRVLKPLKSNSFFIFGARGVGKSYFLKKIFVVQSFIYFNLLKDDDFNLLFKDKKKIERLAKDKTYEWIIIDEIQRLPDLLNEIHSHIEEFDQKFILTGSSSRKLKNGSANLLAGRAYVNSMFPLSYLEIKNKFNLIECLRWGGLPKLLKLNSEEEKMSYLKTYCSVYLKEEISQEQLVRKLEPFRNFLEVAAQMSSKIINFSAIAREVGCDTTTVQTYFSILEDTYLGFYLPAYHKSIRKSQLASPKFYLIDTGIKKALERSLDSKPSEGTSDFGFLFENYLVSEIYKLNSYFHKDWKMSFLSTKNGFEIDLILSKNKKVILIEIKSYMKIQIKDADRLAKVRADFGKDVQIYILSRDERKEKIGPVIFNHWQLFLEKFSEL